MALVRRKEIPFAAVGCLIFHQSLIYRFDETVKRKLLSNYPTFPNVLIWVKMDEVDMIPNIRCIKLISGMPNAFIYKNKRFECACASEFKFFLRLDIGVMLKVCLNLSGFYFCK